MDQLKRLGEISWNGLIVMTGMPEESTHNSAIKRNDLIGMAREYLIK